MNKKQASKKRIRGDKKQAKIRQAILRGESAKQIIKHVGATEAQIDAQLRAMIDKGIRRDSQAFSLSQVGFILGWSSQAGRARQLVESEVLPAAKIGAQWVVTKEDLLSLITRLETEGRPIRHLGRRYNFTEASKQFGVDRRRISRLVEEHGMQEAVRRICKESKSKPA